MSKSYFNVWLFLTILSSCTSLHQYAWQDEAPESFGGAQWLLPSYTWQGEYMPFETEQSCLTQGDDNLLSIYRDISNKTLSFPYNILCRVTALGRFRDGFSDWRCLLEDETASVPVYITGGIGLNEGSLGNLVSLDVWGVEERYGHIQLTKISNLKLVHDAQVSFYVRPWENDPECNGQLTLWTGVITGVEGTDPVTIRSASFPEIRLPLKEYSRRPLQVGDRITVLAPVTAYYSTWQVDMVNYMPGSQMEYIYVHQ